MLTSSYCCQHCCPLPQEFNKHFLDIPTEVFDPGKAPALDFIQKLQRYKLVNCCKQPDVLRSCFPFQLKNIPSKLSTKASLSGISSSNQA